MMHVTAESTSADTPEQGPIQTVELPRTFSLPGGQIIEVRNVCPDDALALQQLFERLSDEDRYRRFFSPHHPDRAFYDRLAAIGDRGGAAVVAVDLEDTSIIAEADYELQSNGNGEMAIVVDESWRGWLGPYLVGVLAAVAAENGVPNLEALILTTNRPMRAMTRTRGEAVLPGSDWQTVRVEFSTTGRAPGWFATDRPKVLVEMRSSAYDVLDQLASDYAVVACAGPSGRPRPCPLLEGGECPLAAGADAIIIAMADDDERNSLVAGHHARHDQVPVEVVAPEQHPARCATVQAAVERALMRSATSADSDHGEPGS